MLFGAVGQRGFDVRDHVGNIRQAGRGRAVKLADLLVRRAERLPRRDFDVHFQHFAFRRIGKANFVRRQAERIGGGASGQHIIGLAP